MPTTQRVAYVRVSSAGQNLARQLEAIGDVDKTYREYQSGSTTSQRPVDVIARWRGSGGAPWHG